MTDEMETLRKEAQAFVDAINADINRIFGTNFHSPPVVIHEYGSIDYAYNHVKDEIWIPRWALERGEPLEPGTLAHEMGHRLRGLTGLQPSKEEIDTIINHALIQHFGADALERISELERESDKLRDEGYDYMGAERVENRTLLAPFRDLEKSYRNRFSKQEECAADSISHLLGYGGDKIAELEGDFGKQWGGENGRDFRMSTSDDGGHPSHEERIAMLSALQAIELAPNSIISFDEDCNILTVEQGLFVPDVSGKMQWQKE